MQKLSQTIFDSYQVRKTRAQKTAFIELLQKELPGHNVKIEECKGVAKSRNIVIGDLTSAEYILTAHYDTQPVMPFPNFIAPKNTPLSFLYAILIVMPFAILVGLLAGFIRSATDSPALAFAICYPLLFAYLAMMMLGKANKHTANDNTSGVITLIEALRDETIRAKCAFVFFDNEELGLLGSKAFSKLHKTELEGKLLLNFDCVGLGDHFMLVQGKKAKPVFEGKLKEAFLPEDGKTISFECSCNTRYPSDQKNFKLGVGVAAFKKARFIGYYMDKIHTKHDTVLQEENVSFLVSSLRRLCE